MTAASKSVLVIGGGVAGLTVARALAQQHVTVHLVEQSAGLGGHAARFTCKATESCVKCGACMVVGLMQEVQAHPAITCWRQTTVAHVASGEGWQIRLANGAGQPAGKTLQVDAIVVATGFTPYNPVAKPYGYGRFANVLTNLDLENMLHTRSYTGGQVVCPSNGQPPGRMAFIQCVGSRDAQLKHLWCSQVCCASALRMANLILHRQPDTQISVFYIDIQTFGKDFAYVYDNLQQRLHFIRTLPSDIGETAPGVLQATWFLAGDAQESQAEFDLVVLSVGLTPADSNAQLAAALAADIGADGFWEADATQSRKPGQGLFAAGTARGPKGIADSMACAGQTASKVLAYLSEVSR